MAWLPESADAARHRGVHATQQPLQHDDRFSISGSQASERSEGELRLGECEHARFQFESAVPAHGGAIELVRTLDGEEVEVVEGFKRRRRPDLAERDLGLKEISPLDRAG